MKISLQFETVDFLYTSPIVIQKHTLAYNQMLIVSVFSQNSFLGLVELSTLPHFHQYSLKEWHYTLAHFFSRYEINLDHILLNKPFFNMVNATESYEGELLFAIESVLFVVLEKLAHRTLSLIEKKPVKINGLYSPFIPLETIPKCIKIKIRPNANNLAETILTINHLLKNQPTIRLRLDGNRSFEIKDLVNYMENLKNACGPSFILAIDYLEEPLKNINQQIEFNKIYYYPMALDESLIAYKNHLSQLKKFPLGLNLILKPSLLGISKSFQIMSLFKDNCIVSSSYESLSALRPYLYLAALNPTTFHGLDTLKFLPKSFGIPSQVDLLNF